MAELRPVGPPFGRRAGDARSGWSQTWAIVRVVLVVAAAIGVLWLIYTLRSLLLLLVLSVFFAYLLAPLVALVSSPFRVRGVERRLSEAAAIAVVYLALFALLAVALAWLIPRFSQQVAQIADQAPAYVKAVQGGGAQITGRFERMGLPANAQDAVHRVLTTVLADVGVAAERSLSAAVGLFAYLPWLVLIPILGFFLLKDGETLLRGGICLLPKGRARSDAVELFERVNLALAAYIRAQLIACVLVGVIVGLGFTLLGMPYPVILGVVAGLAEFVPLVGPAVVALVSAIVAAVHAPLLALWVLVFLAIVRIAEDYIVYPRLVGLRVNLHPLAIVVAVLAGAELGGVPGVFLAVPILAVLTAAYRQFGQPRRPAVDGDSDLSGGETRTA